MIRAVCLAALGLAALPGALRSQESSAGFVAIFDGKSLNQWDGDPSFWRVEAGVIIAESTTEKRLAQNSFLIWRGGLVRDFELTLEYRMTSNANSGVQYRSVVLEHVGRWVMKGYQADLDGADRYTGQIYEERGRGFLALRGAFVRVTGTQAGGKQAVGSFGDDATFQTVLKPGEWNALHIIARGNLIIQLVNGRVMSALIDEDEQGRALEGLLGLQLHAGSPMKIEFRNVRLKPL